MSLLFRLIPTALFFLVAVALHTPLMAQDLQALQVIAIEGQFLDQASRQVEEYCYIKPGLRYRLLPGQRLIYPPSTAGIHISPWDPV